MEHTFVYRDGTIYWANMGNYKRELSYLAVDCHDNMLWFEKLVLREGVIYDYYIISKKYKWLISKNHHMIVSFVGDELKTKDLFMFDNSY